MKGEKVLRYKWRCLFSLGLRYLFTLIFIFTALCYSKSKLYATKQQSVEIDNKSRYHFNVCMIVFFFSSADVDECAAGIAVCPRFRKCINTFGSYICKCHEGFDLQYINGKYQCIGTVSEAPH